MNNFYLKIIVVLVISSTTLMAQASSPQSFRTSKKLMSKYVYNDYDRSSFYCNCPFKLKAKPSGKGVRLTPDWSKCGFTPRKNTNRASRIEWEHIMPAHHFGQHLSCWRQGGRKACKKDPYFSKLEADMHNLVPAIGEVNGDRSNFKFGMLQGEPRVYGQCDAEVNFKMRRFEPQMSVRGDIARTYFYMAHRYKINLSKQQINLFKAWNKQDPVSEWERIRNQRIERIQGNSNPYIQ